MAKEKALDNKVLKYLKTIDAWGLKYWAGAKFTKEGIPDILACINGRFFGIEDKGPTGIPSMLQLKNLEWIRNAEGYGILLYPNDFDRFKSFIESDFTDLHWYNENVALQKKWIKKLQKI